MVNKAELAKVWRRQMCVLCIAGGTEWIALSREGVRPGRVDGNRRLEGSGPASPGPALTRAAGTHGWTTKQHLHLFTFIQGISSTLQKASKSKPCPVRTREDPEGRERCQRICVTLSTRQRGKLLHT